MYNKDLQRTSDSELSMMTQKNDMKFDTREMARVQSEVFMAKQFPRDMEKVLSYVKSDCSVASLADQAVYQYAKGGTNITGPSIRLAEVLARRMGNIRFGFEILEENEYVTKVRCFANDLESNAQSERVFLIPHMRHTKRGDSPLTDPREIYETVANNSQRRVRACILALIPGDIVEAAVKTCTDTLEKKINLTQETRNAIIESFAQYDISKAMIEKRIQRKMEAITPNLVVSLRQVLKSIKDGIGKPEDYFDFSLKDIDVTPPKEDKKPKKKAKNPVPKKEPEPEPDPEEETEYPDPEEELPEEDEYQEDIF